MGTLLQQGDQFIGSHIKAEAFTGQNGGLNPSVIKPGEKLPRSTVAKSIMAADGSVTATPWAGQTHTVSAKPLKASPGMKRPDNSAKVPNVLNRGGHPSTVPAKRGNAKR
jgi:hypothetical protein